MGSLANKSPANTYKSLLKVADETNGISTSNQGFKMEREQIHAYP